MDWQQIFVAALVVMVFIAFVREWLAPELVAIGALLLCAAVGILDLRPSEPNYALKVFGHPAVVTVAAMFVLSAALEKTGVIEWLGELFEKLAGKGRKRVLAVMMALVALLSGFVNNTPVVVVFMPIVIALCRKRDLKASKYLIPLSYAAIVGGTMTIIGTSTNLIAAGFAEETPGVEPFSMFDILPLGLVYVAVTFAYLLLFGNKLLPDRATLASLIDTESSREFITHAVVKRGSSLAGKPFPETWLASYKGTRVIDVIRDGKRLKTPLVEIVFGEGDEVLIKGKLDGVMGVTRDESLEIAGEEGGEDAGLEGVRTESAVIMEGIIGPDSNLVGKTLAQLNFRQRYGVLILAVHRRGENLREKFETVPLAFGDTLLVQGSRERMDRLFRNKDFINLSERDSKQLRYHLAPIPIIAILAFIIMNTFGVPSSFLALGGAVLVMAFRCVEPKEAYEAIDWRVIFMIYGMLGVGMALEATGLASRLADLVVNGCGGLGPHFLLAAFYLLAALMTELISNNAVAALLTPLAIIVGQQLGLEDPRPFIVAVMFGASASFATPIGYQTNTFVYGAGGYKFQDFFKAGFPLAILLWLLASFLIPILFPFEFSAN